MSGKFKDKKIMVTGACGTVGKELIKQLLNSDKYELNGLIGIDNNESELFFLDQEYLDNPKAQFFVSDIRDGDAMIKTMSEIDIVFHTAALKHVILCERSPDQAVTTNIHGIQNIIKAANHNKVEKVIFTSSDKAVNPTNVMGTTKLMGERLITAANSYKSKSKTIFASTRFGNVLGSNGSVIPIFKKQILHGGPVTLTDREMTRFVMSIKDSVQLVIDSAEQAIGGEVFITKMPVIRIEDLARVMINLLAPKYGYNPSDIKIVQIGSKPGEKLYEELMNNEETRRAVELKNYFSVLPAFRSNLDNKEYLYQDQVNNKVTNPYISMNENPLSMEELQNYLETNNLISDS